MDTPDGAGDRLKALGNQMIEVHVWLLETLIKLRTELAADPDGSELPSRQLLTHCVAFCSALDAHHRGEDRSAFPALAQQFPALEPVLGQLKQDHEFMAEILRRIDELVDTLGSARLAGAAQVSRIRTEIEGLSAILESHLRYEEKKIANALKQLPESAVDTTDFLLAGRPTS